MVNKDQVRHIAKLARLGITEDENKKFQKDISSIFDYFEMLEEVDVSGGKPTFHSTEEFIKNTEISRKDEVKSEDEESVKNLIESASDKKGRYIKVKAVL
jgi:aspartyl-tRNA(Asn)/glutamyl-tRNA(Gln) amidotransferase subunit C